METSHKHSTFLKVAQKVETSGSNSLIISSVYFVTEDKRHSEAETTDTTYFVSGQKDLCSSFSPDSSYTAVAVNKGSERGLICRTNRIILWQKFSTPVNKTQHCVTSQM